MPRGSSGASDLPSAVRENLRRLRSKKGLSLERLSRVSGVSRSMLGQIEQGKSTPTLQVLSKIVRGLGVSVMTLVGSRALARTTVLRSNQVVVLESRDGGFTRRALFPYDEPHPVQFYEVRLAARATGRPGARPPGTVENLVVTAGSLEVSVGTQKHRLAAGDAILFDADVPHAYRNPGDVETRMYLVVRYAEQPA